MPTQANAVPPSLVNEMAELKRRMAAIENAPIPANKFDRYPAVEWAAKERDRIGDNSWSSVSIANVTGMSFDRVECKFIVDRMIAGKRLAEIRLAAFRHTGNAVREIVSASGVTGFNGKFGSSGAIVVRWIHGIPFGWDYADDTTVYTIELQHRYRKGPESPKGQSLYTIAATEGAPSDGVMGYGYQQDSSGKWWWVPTFRGGSPWSAQFVTIPNQDRGTYSISSMHYCVGLPQGRIPEANVNAWMWARGTGIEYVRGPDISEPYLDI
ncbi:hypothetical protein A6A06_23560 [Streptomyces sp. CB02923]|uniref:hypothetical protein n=1 Tax=Streptomyces sp. CB02923 TaxID=1718985 RepID=UPI0009389720|nr:hypothetical protein [Streptomyces sp. CB02923]OKH99999.1 hypothetical protein A6A06_23560 [Streptomyces sp. CB02923]